MFFIYTVTHVNYTSKFNSIKSRFLYRWQNVILAHGVFSRLPYFLCCAARYNSHRCKNKYQNISTDILWWVIACGPGFIIPSIYGYKRIRYTGSVKIWKTRHKISVDIRIFLYSIGLFITLYIIYTESGLTSISVTASVSFNGLTACMI